MIAVQWIMLVLFCLISWEAAARIARFYFNKVYVRVLLRVEGSRWLWLLIDFFIVAIPVILLAVLIAVLLEVSLVRLFPALINPFFDNLRVIISGTIFMLIFYVQMHRDTEHYFKLSKELIESGKLEELVEQAYKEVQREEAEEEKKRKSRSISSR